MICNETYYGGFRTRYFTQIFPDVETFRQMYTEVELPNALQNENSIDTIFYLLYARYGNSNIAYSDETQFIYALMSIIFMYGPSWEKRLEVQQSLRELSEEDLIKGGKAIYNHSYNPGTAPSTSTLEELTTINDQNTTNYKKSKMEAYSTLLALLETDVTEEFIGKFKKLFITILAPDYPLLYKTTEELTND